MHYGELGQLKSLSFDPQWLSSNIPANSQIINGLSHLKTLVNLEELYFADCKIATPSMNFLEPLTKLKHLQIPSIDRTKQGNAGFDVCQSLESITFLGAPDKTSIAELSKLPKLKKVTVVDSLNDGLDSRFEAMLKKSIPSAEIRIVPAGTLFADVPESFQQHVKVKRKEIRDRWLQEAKNRSK